MMENQAQPLEMPEMIGGVRLDYTYYDGVDAYNEGDEVENLVLDTFRNGADPRTVLQADDRWPVLYQLSPTREVIVAPMCLQPQDRVLEIGAGMGAVTGAIARRSAHVDCVELSLRRSLANAYRNKRYSNISILVGNYEKVQLTETYDVATLVGVLEYAGYYIHGSDQPAHALLSSVAAHLRPGGRIYIAIENKLGIKYFAGCAEDHIGLSYAGIEGYPDHQGVRTYTHSELKSLLAETGYSDVYFYYPYPDYKMPSVIYSDDMPSGEFFPPVVNMDLPRYQVFDENRTMLSLMGTEEFKMLANSFLVEAVKR